LPPEVERAEDLAPDDGQRPRRRPAAMEAALRALPSVDAVLGALIGHPDLTDVSRGRLTEAVRHALDAERRRLLAAGAVDPDRAATQGVVASVIERLRRTGPFSLDRVINATGVVLHTNLGRAILSPLAQARVLQVARAYSNLELDVEHRERGSRYAHVQGLLQRLTGAGGALVVNNCAAAVLLALETLARGKEVIVSRGELIEIGGEFRIPDIMRRSGALLREVGTTNRTHLRDYRDAIGPETALILKVHPSNYRVVGFTADVGARELAELGRARGVPVMEDLGSGCLLDLRPYGFPLEPTVPETVASGIDLVTFSGDKLLGGPQAGIVVGRAELIERLARNPLNRALRIDKLTIAALEGTLHAYEAGTALETVPTLRMLSEPSMSIRRRAQAVLRRLAPDQRQALGAALVEVRSQIGGGALPTVELPSAGLALGTAARPAPAIDEALRAARPPVVGRILDDRLLLDCRTVLPDDVDTLARTLAALVSA
jgi:L-seryl-tRNA(Ser) seleniumtransferase